MSGDGLRVAGEEWKSLSRARTPGREPGSSAKASLSVILNEDLKEMRLQSVEEEPSRWWEQLEQKPGAAAGLCENSREAGVRGPQALSSGCAGPRGSPPPVKAPVLLESPEHPQGR